MKIGKKNHLRREVLPKQYAKNKEEEVFAKNWVILPHTHRDYVIEKNHLMPNYFLARAGWGYFEEYWGHFPESSIYI